MSEQGDRSDEELHSHEIQRRKVERYLEAKGLLASPERFEDTDRSGGKMSRPAFNRALEGVREGQLGGIAVYHLSRFGRNTVGVLNLVHEFDERGAALVCLTPHIDTASPEGRAMLTVFLAFYTLEREQAVTKARDNAEFKIERGESTGGTAPVGYQWDVLGKDSNGGDIVGWLVPKEPEASIVREAFSKFASGKIATAGRVADFLNESGLRTSRGNLWNGQTIRGFLSREAYIGVRTYGKQRIENAHEPLIEAWLYRKVQRMIAPKGPRAPRSHGEGHILGEGLVRCGKCGLAMTKGLAAGKYPTLRCNGRGFGHAGISYRLAEGWILGVVFAHGVGWTKQSTDEQDAARETAEERLAQARAELEEIEAALGTKAPSDSKQALAVQAAEDALAELERASDIPPVFLTPLGGRQKFEEMPVREQRRALRSIASRVIVSPGRAHVGERITIEFKDGTQHPRLWDESLVPKAVAS